MNFGNQYDSLKEMIKKNLNIDMPISGGFGVSSDDRIIIHSPFMVKMEYFLLELIFYLRKKNYTVVNQFLTKKDEDLLTVRLRDGSEESYYFGSKNYFAEKEQIINDLKKYQINLIDKLTEKKWDHFNLYFKICNQFNMGDVSNNFKKLFCKFYVLNGPSGLTNLQKKNYFYLLSSKETGLKKILYFLNKIPGYQNKHKIYFSFATKLLHTINNNQPIYDSHIATILKLPILKSTGRLENKIDNRAEIYENLKNNFAELLSDKEIKNFINNTRKKLFEQAEMENFAWKDELISDTKMLDSLLWALYCFKYKKQKNIGTNISNNSGRLYMHKKFYKVFESHQGQILTNQEIIRKVKIIYPDIKESSILPSDYCDNNITKDKYSGKYKIFHKEGRNKYRVLTSN